MTTDAKSKKTASKEPKATKVAPARVSKKDEAPLAKLRIRVSAYENKILDASVKQIVDTAIRYDGTIQGPVPLPTEIKKYTVNRSSFIDKNSREQFEMRVHKRLIDILNPSGKIVESLTNLSLPSGVNIDVKML
jgi:small subunit ribosomal protein S10